MREEYDFSDAKRNPYVSKLKKQITIDLNAETLDYFQSQANETGMPYQTLINLYLSECANSKRKIS